MFRNSLAMALCASTDTTRAILVCEEAIKAIELNGDELYLPRLLMTKAHALCLEEDHDASTACLRRAFLLARKQGATVYESQIRQCGSYDV
jgi:hypothetical protein